MINASTAMPSLLFKEIIVGVPTTFQQINKTCRIAAPIALDSLPKNAEILMKTCLAMSL